MSNLISTTELEHKHGLDRRIVYKLLKNVQPAYKSGEGRGRIALYNIDEVEPLVLAEIERRKPAPPPPPIDINAMLDAPDNLKAQVKAVFGAVEIVRHRVEEVMRDHGDLAFQVGVIYHKVDDIIRNGNEDRTKLDQLVTAMMAHTGRLDRLQEDIGNLDANLHQRMDAVHNRLELLGNQMNTILSRLPAPLPMPSPDASDKPVIYADREVPVTITTGPAFKEPKVKRRAVVLGVTDGQRQAIKQEVGDAWELEFFEGSQRYNGKFATAIDKAEFMVVMNSFRGNGPEGLAKEAGKPCYRAAGTRGIVELLIEKL